VHPHPGSLAPGQSLGATVGVPVRQRCGSQFGREPGPHPGGERTVAAGRAIVERSGRGQQGEHPVRGNGVHAEIAGRGEHLMPVPAAVEQAQQAGGTPHPGQRDGPPRVDPDLHRVPVPPYGLQARFQRWSHKENARAAV